MVRRVDGKSYFECNSSSQTSDGWVSGLGVDGGARTWAGLRADAHAQDDERY